MERQNHMDVARKFLFTPIVIKHDPDLWFMSYRHHNPSRRCFKNNIDFSSTSSKSINIGHLLIAAILFLTKGGNRVNVSANEQMCHPGHRRIDVTKQSQNGDGNGECDLNNQSDRQQKKQKIDTLYLRIKPKKKVRVAACDRRIRMLEKVMKADTLETFFDVLGLGKYSLIFRSEGYDMKGLQLLDESLLVCLGIPANPGRRILQALKLKYKA